MMKHNQNYKKGAVQRTSFGKLMVTAALPFFLLACSGGPDMTASKYERVTGGAMAANSPARTRNSFNDLASEMAADGDYDAAIPLYRRAHEAQPFDANSLVGLGTSLAATGKYLEAVEAFQGAVDRNGDNGQALKGLGRAYLALSRPTRAVPYLNAAVNLQPNDVEAISALALALELQGHREASLEIYKDGLSVDPNNLKLLNNYGLSLALQSHHDEAIKLLKQAAQHKDAGATHRQNLAMAYALAGNDVMSTRLLSIDNSPEIADSNMNYFAILASMPMDDRFDSVLRQSGNPKTDTAKPANEEFENDSLIKNITVARLVEEKPQPAVVMVEPEPEDENIPPLLGPEGWALQIAAYRKKSELMPGWEMLKKKYVDIIGHLEPRRSEIDFGDSDTNPRGYFYRLNAGPLTSYEEARIACEQIKERGTDCWVRPPVKAEGDVPEKDQALASQFNYTAKE